VARSSEQRAPGDRAHDVLAAHALPPEFAGRSGRLHRRAFWPCSPQLHAQGLVDAVDAFCERIGFSTGANRPRVFSAAQALGLPVKLHAEQLSDSGGAQLAAGFGALSCDHLDD
jgi:imidazolonepropionase